MTAESKFKNPMLSLAVPGRAVRNGVERRNKYLELKPRLGLSFDS